MSARRRERVPRGTPRASGAAERVVWEATGDVEFPYRAAVGGETWTIRLDDFPVTPSKYTLFVDGVEREPIAEWPACWTRPQGARRAATPGRPGRE